MRLPFITRRNHEAAVDFLAAVHQVNLDDARKAQFEAEAEVAVGRLELRRAVAYVGQAEGRRDTDGHRLARALRAVAAERRQSAAYRRTITRLTDQLLDATGYQGEPLLPEARRVLDLDKEDA
ncbi:hypothetical protein [Streptomyces sp. NPDC058718]|uniref:hypothetical protein n=1 Tax=Streptomyces sp. NPDC058718 TaxID=3346610 RepID=UPI0036A6CFFE